MYTKFQATFKKEVTDEYDASCQTALSIIYGGIPGYRKLFSSFGGASFNNGIYRVICQKDIISWTNSISGAFPEFSERIAPFGYDWLGRAFCFDVSLSQKSAPCVLLFSNFSDEVLEIPVGIAEFHNTVLVEQQEAALEITMFNHFLKASGLSFLHASQCAEIVVPLYLGGAYSIDNLRVSDVVTNWNVASQLLSQSRSIDEGTHIEKVSLRRPS